jgi:hypothetical protein
METSLHRSLKMLYAADATLTEVAVDGFRIDAIDADGWLVEVQHAGLGSIRRKVIRLVENHQLRLVKPLIGRKWIERYDPKTKRLVSRRRSPKQATRFDIFGHLLHFTGAFPHANLVLEIPFVEVVEHRHPSKPRRRWRDRDSSIDQQLVNVTTAFELRTNQDLWDLIGNPPLPDAFDTKNLADAIEQPRWLAQQITYVLRHSGAISVVGKRGNSILYSCSESKPKRKSRKSA